MSRIARHPACLLMVMAALGGCAELRTPATPAQAPLALVAGTGDPFRGTVQLVAVDFADQGVGLQNRPAAMARAAARLEFMTQAATQDPRYAALPTATVLALGGAVREVRQALGIAPSALPEQVVSLLSDAAASIDTGRDPVLPEAVFPAGPVLTRQRLAAPGPLPEAAIATGRLQETVAALDAGAGWGGGTMVPVPGG